MTLAGELVTAAFALKRRLTPEELATVPPWQWSVIGAWWRELAGHCPERVGVGPERMSEFGPYFQREGDRCSRVAPYPGPQAKTLGCGPCRQSACPRAVDEPVP